MQVVGGFLFSFRLGLLALSVAFACGLHLPDLTPERDQGSTGFVPSEVLGEGIG